MKKLIFFCILILFFNSLFSQTFTEQTDISLTEILGGSVIWGDYDNDNDLDIILTGYTNRIYVSKIYKNGGDNTFTYQNNISIGDVASGSVAWGDYDNDGYIDLLVTGYTNSFSPFSKIYRNNGNNSFTAQNNISLTAVYDGSVAWEDYNNDGYLDILLTGYTGSTNISKVYKNNGNNTFTEQKSISLPGVKSGAVAWCDYDKDGNPDILLTGSTGTNCISKIYTNQGDGTFKELSTVSLVGVCDGSVAWGDYDNDGYPDILLTGWNGNNSVSKVYKNIEGNNFVEQTGISLTPVNECAIAWGDYNNDGYLDIILTGYSGGNRYSKIYKNNQDNTFSEQSSISITAVGYSTVAWGDYDNDSDLDLLITGDISNGNYAKIYKNESSLKNSSPTPPVPTIPFVDQNTVVLAWQSATDDHTPSSGLTYNVYVKDIRSGGMLGAPMADLTSGYRRIVQMGNTYYNRNKIFYNLDCGEYEWQIQSIDNCFSGSDFASGENFTISNPLPPTNLSAKQTSISDIYLKWKDNSKGETGYVIERSTINNLNYTPIITLKANDSTYTDNGLQPGITYFYRVKAINNNYSSEYSNEQQVIISLFVEQTTLSFAGVFYGAVSWCDYDNDGDLDILLTGRNSSGSLSRIYKNNGKNSFSEQTGIPLIDLAHGAVSWCDYNNDGLPDILLTGNAGIRKCTYLYKNNGNNTFSEQTGTSFPDVDQSSVSWGDYDNDGDPDLLISGSLDYSSVSQVYRNNGNNSFELQSGISLPGMYTGTSSWVDLDNDGYLDILMVGRLNSSDFSCRIYKNNGDNTFTEKTGTSLPSLYNCSVAIGDYDNDGDFDLLFSGSSRTEYITKIYKNNGNFSFSAQNDILLCGVNDGAVAWGDYDNDGFLDILLTGNAKSNAVSKVYHNNGNNTFSETTEIFLPEVYSSTSTWADYDNDGDLDVLLSGYSKSGSPITKIFKNEINNTNHLPSSPVNMVQTINNATVTLGWDKGNDPDASTKGLYYNIYLKKSSGENFIVSPLSNSTNGYRKIVSTGNAGINNSITIKNIPEGTYSWSVQSIDQRFAGSQFSEPKTFSVILVPDKPQKPIGTDTLCINAADLNYSVSKAANAQSYVWSLEPSTAGTITGINDTAKVNWNNSFIGIAKISVKGERQGIFGPSSDTLYITIIDKPSAAGIITGENMICLPSSKQTYSVPEIEWANKYSWSLPSGLTGNSTINTISVSFNDSAKTGNISVRGENKCGTGIESTLLVNINNTPEKPIITKTGNILQSSASSGNQWYKQKEPIPNANQPQLISSGDGSYYVLVTQDGCTSDASETYIITGNPNLSSVNNVKIYPNPVQEKLFIITGENMNGHYKILNINGKTIYQNYFSGNTTVETQNISPGIYFIRFESGTYTYSTSFIKE
jgi:hypothetical protein